MISSSYMKLVLLGFKHGLEVSRVRGGIQGKRSFQSGDLVQFFPLTLGRPR